MVDIAKEIASALSEYTDEVTEGLEEAKKEVAKATVKKLKVTSPKFTGDYARGWRVKKVGSNYVVHNKTDYQLTHLLEHGHVLREGGRAEAIPHIRPAEEEAINEYVERAERVIRG